MITNQEVFDNGDMENSWPCDENQFGEVESNGGIECLYYYNDKFYLIVTDYENTYAYQPHLEAHEVTEQELNYFTHD